MSTGKDEAAKIASKLTTREIISALKVKQSDFETALMESAGEVTDQIEQIEAEIEEISEATEQKIANVLSYMDYLDQLIMSIDASAELYRQRLKSHESKIKGLKSSKDYLESRIHEALHALGKRKAYVDDRTVWIQEYDKLEIEGLDDTDKDKLIDNGYGELRTSKYIDKRKIKSDIKEGKFKVENFSTDARIQLTKSESLRIK